MTAAKLNGRVGGFTDKGNGNGKKQKEKPEISTFKYSTRLTGPLHEAVIVEGKPCFIRDSPEIGDFTTVERIEETNRILVPPYSEEYPYEPFEFESLKELRKYRDMAFDETIDSLYEKVKGIVTLFVDQDPEIINLNSADIVWTFFQDMYPTTHYYDITGKENGIGKSTIGYVFQGVSYRAVRMTDPNAANLYRLLGKVEAGQCIIIADEADRLHTEKELLAIWKEGYGIDGKVARVNPNTLKQEFFYCYCFKIRIAEESLRSNYTKGVIDRSFLIKAVKGRPTYDIKEVLHPASRNEKFEKLHNELKSLRKVMLAYRLIHFSDNHPDIETGLEGRNKELCKPLLHLFHDSDAYAEVRSTLQTFLDRKNKRKKNTAIEPAIYGLVVDLVSRLGKEIPTAQVWNTITCEDSPIPGFYEGDKKPNDYQTQDYGTIYRDATAKMIYDNFGAEPKHTKRGNIFVFDLKKLARAGKAYDIEGNIQDKLDGEAGEPGEASVESDKLLDQNIDRKTEEPERESDNISNEKSANKEISEEVKGVQGPIPAQEASLASRVHHASKTSRNNNNIYRLGTHSDQFGCQDCKLRGDKHFMQEHNCRGGQQKNKNKSNNKSKSKSSAVADMAKANLSRDGVIDKESIQTD